MEEDLDLENLEATTEPELCEEGGKDGIECDANLTEDGSWYCSTCQKFV